MGGPTRSRCGFPARSTTASRPTTYSPPSTPASPSGRLAETTRDTLAWLDATPDAVVSGISIDRERELLAAWHATSSG